MCGQCCRAISLDLSPRGLRDLADRERARLETATPHRTDVERLLRDISFILERFRPMARAQAVAINPELADLEGRHFYSCDALAADGSCSCHSGRPYVCEGYPWYHGAPNPALLVHRPCGYEHDVE
jgi:Fe-S-cluster containining protein